MAEREQADFSDCGRQDCRDMHSWGPGMRTHYVVHYIIHGKGRFCRGEKRYTLHTGESFIIRPYEEIRYAPDPDDPWEYIWIDFSGEAYVRLLDQIDAVDRCVIPPLEASSVLPFYEALFALSGRPDKRCTTDLLTQTILGVYADSFPLTDERSREAACFETARRLIRAGYQQPSFGIPALCESLSVSRATLHRYFIRQCGMSPGAYLTAYRMDRAKEFLAHGSAVKAAALSCGFSDQLYFSKAFRTAVGVSPSEYRRQLAAPAQPSPTRP